MGFIRQFLQPSLGHASYLVGDTESGRAIVIDPSRHIAQYLDAARDAGVEIAYVADTHGHNDYLSGQHALADATGAIALAPIDAQVQYPAQVTHHDMVIELGPTVHLRLLHTPGHTPEHTAFLVSGLASHDVLFSGGSLLVGDIGRPDLLGDAAEIGHAADASARTLTTLLDTLDGGVPVLPTHVGGSLCAGNISDGTDTTIAEQRQSNSALKALNESASSGTSWFDAAQLPPVPAFWPTSRALNLRGVPAVGEAVMPEVSLDAAVDAQLVLDVRSVRDAALTHVPGAVNVPLGASFPVWAGIVAHGFDSVLIIAGTADEAARANEQLLLVHEQGAFGWVSTDALQVTGARPVPTRWFATPESIFDDVEVGERILVDVRNPAEIAARPIPGARTIPAATLLSDPTSVPEGPLALVCAAGYRALVVASVLSGRGVDVIAVDGAPFPYLQPVLA